MQKRYKVSFQREYLQQSGKLKKVSRTLVICVGVKRDPAEAAINSANRQWPNHQWKITSLTEVPFPKKYTATIERTHVDSGRVSFKTLDFKADYDEDPWDRASWIAIHQYIGHFDVFIKEIDEHLPDGTLKRLSHNYFTLDLEAGHEVSDHQKT